MQQRLSATEARVHFGELLRRVSQHGDTFIVEKSGEPSAVVLPLEEYRRLRQSHASHEGLEILDRARALRLQIKARREGRPLPNPEDILAETREARTKVLDEFL